MTSTTATSLRVDLRELLTPTTENAPFSDALDISWECITHVLREMHSELAQSADGSEQHLTKMSFITAAAAFASGLVAGRGLEQQRQAPKSGIAACQCKLLTNLGPVKFPY